MRHRTDLTRTKFSPLIRRQTGGHRRMAALVLAFFAILASACGSASESAGTTAGTTENPIETTAASFPDLPATEAVTIDGAELPILQQGSDPAVGTPAPSLTGSDMSGQPIAIEADGRPKAVYFIAHWCPHCQREVPVIQGLLDDEKNPEGLDIYAVSTSVDETRGNYPPASWLTNERFQPPTMRDDINSSAYVAYGGSGFPFAVYLDGDNNVVRRTAGELGSDQILALWQELAAE